MLNSGNSFERFLKFPVFPIFSEQLIFCNNFGRLLLLVQVSRYQSVLRRSSRNCGFYINYLIYDVPDNLRTKYDTGTEAGTMPSVKSFKSVTSVKS